MYEEVITVGYEFEESENLEFEEMDAEEIDAELRAVLGEEDDGDEDNAGRTKKVRRVWRKR